MTRAPKIFRNKAGVSPLIATVLLIAFAVALGAVVMNWGRTYVEETTSYAKSKSDVDVACSMDVSLKAVEIGGVPQICYNNSNNYVRFMIKNSGTVNISELEVQVIGAGGIYTNSSLPNSSLGRAQIIRKNITFDTAAYGNFSQIIITPKIAIKGINMPCPDQNLVKESTELTECSS